jgi:hypothetical protein
MMMKLLDIAKRSNLTFDKIREIAEEIDESIDGMTKNTAHFHLIKTLEQMMIYGDLYVYEGRYPVEEPEIVNMPKEELNNARCIGRFRYEQLLCKSYPENNYDKLLDKSHFYQMIAHAYDTDKYDEVLEVFESSLIKMSNVEYQEWNIFLKPQILLRGFRRYYDC